MFNSNRHADARRSRSPNGDEAFVPWIVGVLALIVVGMLLITIGDGPRQVASVDIPQAARASR